MIKKIFNKKNIKEFILINLGVILVAFTFTFFLDQNNLVFGGVSGIGVILRNLFGDKIPSSLIILVVNILLLLVGLIFLGKSFFVKTIYGSIMFPVYSFIFEQVIPQSFYPTLDKDILIIIVVAGIMMGTGLGLALRYGASTGGVDILQTILLKYFKIPLSVSLVIFDGGILSIGAFTGFSGLGTLTMLLYGMAYIALSGYIMDNVVFGGFNVRAAYVVTTKPNEIKQEIFKKLNRGVTELYTRGGYTMSDQMTLLCVLTTREYYYLRSIALQIDPKAFIFVARASEVHGEGFTYDENE